MKKILNKFKGSISDILIVLALTYLAFVSNRKFDSQDLVGCALIIVSIATWLVARYQLGESFSILPQSKSLITSGIYSKIRHPLYICSIVATFGLCLMYKAVWVYIVWLLLIVLQIFRATKEEKILENKFGNEFLNYKRSTWF